MQLAGLNALSISKGHILPNFESNTSVSQVVHVDLEHAIGRLLVVTVTVLGGGCNGLRQDVVRIIVVFIERVLVDIFPVVKMVDYTWFAIFGCPITAITTIFT